MDCTKIVEDTINSLAGSRGLQAVRLYRKYGNPVNFAIVCVIGVVFYFVLSNLALGFLGLGVGWFWVWLNSVGPFGHWWGFKPVPVKKTAKLKVKAKDAVTVEVNE